VDFVQFEIALDFRNDLALEQFCGCGHEKNFVFSRRAQKIIETIFEKMRKKSRKIGKE